MLQSIRDHYSALWKDYGSIAHHCGPLQCIAEKLWKPCVPLQTIVVALQIHCGTLADHCIWLTGDHAIVRSQNTQHSNVECTLSSAWMVTLPSCLTSDGHLRFVL